MDVIEGLFEALGFDPEFTDLGDTSEPGLVDFIKFIEAATQRGVFADLGVTNVGVTLQRGEYEVVAKVCFSLPGFIFLEFSPAGWGWDEMQHPELEGYEQGRAVIEGIRAAISRAIAELNKGFKPRT